MNMTAQYDIATSRQQALAQVIGSQVSKPGDYGTLIEGLGFFRREHPSAPIVCMSSQASFLSLRQKTVVARR